VNLAVSRLSVSEAGGQPKLVFSGVRHGVHCAWEINDANIRTAANVQRAKEAVIAAFLAKYDGSANPPSLPDAGPDGTINVPMHLSSVSLLTPDTIRHTIKKNSSSDERRMLVEQSAAWDTVARDGVTFQHNGRQIHIQPTIMKFNFGVNAGAVKFSKLNATLFGGWDLSTQMNTEAFAVLSQEAEAFIQNTHNDEKTRNAARVLLNQCRQVFQAKGERKDSHDAYKLAARVAVLTQLIGNVPCWNCKSGKDRTGEMDVECKFLATLIARGETIPAPGARLTEEQKGLFRSIALEGGNFEIQKMNTGLAGFKTGGVSSIPERLGGKNYREFHSGGSQFVNV
jgi:hypothetical protein